ncbi:MAG TPA: adenine phosphoribosyltransferase [Kiritimatiellia bacterium]|nr:adenine phosphoribosyltransferase [Kiritimatiellia bacterium]HMP00678.1 adenine phosphoribosyltransferase [Kiritimatiellia bacterium]
MLEHVRNAIRDIPDFPQPGIIFKDITPVLKSPPLYADVVRALTERVRELQVDKIAVIESRGFLFGAPVAYELGLGLVPIRKKGKLPYKTIEESYALEYGSATLEVHEDAFEKGERVVVLDDLLATGGTALASAKLIERLGANVAEFLFLVELAFLDGRKRLNGYSIFAPVVY